MDLPKNNSSYKDKEYWNNRFAKEDTFEWCKSYKEFRHLLRGHVRTCDRILILGCGNSGLSEDMYNEGYTDITNIDYSPIVIENMKRKCHAMRGMEWKVMDITKLDFPPNSFDVVIEKATLDALLVAEKDPWNPSVEALKTMECVLSKVSEILEPAGHFMSMTFSQPNFRLPFLARSCYNWSISVQTYGESFHFFFFLMEKGKQLSEKHKEGAQIL
ncbi:predicted protein [Nematostella vectensis]|uniref:EEF1A lysine methyltransferase 4 n=1 Tax=Nematostella vectensis TaxID=45351 RepID=A7RW62_NEMVE|nr:predicted protein [Nematostella vectensis]|eukprot:XP_001636272.1 predicted protein [Nematostella vectensis]